jgi:hypothetical protein
MGLFNVSLLSSENPSVHAERQKPSTRIGLYMRSLAEPATPVTNRRLRGAAAGQAVKANCSVSCSKETIKGCRDRVSDSEYQHLVELGHWHHRRQRRRNRR